MIALASALQLLPCFQEVRLPVPHTSAGTSATITIDHSFTKHAVLILLRIRVARNH
jgi:hypothetical protein